jgi:hypothetical protein
LAAALPLDTRLILRRRVDGTAESISLIGEAPPQTKPIGLTLMLRENFPAADPAAERRLFFRSATAPKALENNVPSFEPTGKTPKRTPGSGRR